MLKHLIIILVIVVAMPMQAMRQSACVSKSIMRSTLGYHHVSPGVIAGMNIQQRTISYLKKWFGKKTEKRVISVPVQTLQAQQASSSNSSNESLLSAALVGGMLLHQAHKPQYNTSDNQDSHKKKDSGQRENNSSTAVGCDSAGTNNEGTYNSHEHTHSNDSGSWSDGDCGGDCGSGGD